MMWTSRLCLSTLLCAVSSAAAGRASAAFDLSADAWEAHLTISDGSSRQRLSFGMRPDATIGYDLRYDVAAMFGSGMRAYYYHPGWAGGSYYFRDIVDGRFPAAFTVTIERAPAGARVSVAFDVRYVTAGCERVDLYLVDAEAGTRTDMRLETQYTFTSTGAKRELRIESELVTSPLPGAPIMVRGVQAGQSGRVLAWWTAPEKGAAVAGYNLYRAFADNRLELLNRDPLHGERFRGELPAPDGEVVGILARALNYQLCEGPASNMVPALGDDNDLE